MKNLNHRAWSKTLGMRQVMGWLGTTLYVENGGAGHDAMTMENWVLMQSTSLFDKNGKEIYEGDIIRAECEPNGQIHQQTVEWTEAGYWFNEEFGMDYYPPLSDEDIEVEVIGNIYENSDLLV